LNPGADFTGCHPTFHHIAKGCISMINIGFWIKTTAAKALAGCLVWVANAHAYTFPTHTQSVSINLPANNGQGYYNHDMHVTWHQEPAAGWGMYAMYWFMFQAGQGGYTGLQKTTDPNRPKTAIFSIWDVGNSKTALPVPGNACVRFGNEGTGTSCIIAFNWKPDTEYKMRVWKLSGSASTTSAQWGAWVVDVKTMEETFIGAIELLNANGHVGYGSLNAQGMQAVTEFFAGPATADCSNLPAFNVTWKGPFGNNGSLNPTSATGGYQTGIGTPCAQANHFSGAPFTITQENGATVQRTSTGNNNLWGNYNLARYNSVDCILNWAETQYPNLLNQSPFKQRRLSQAMFHTYYRDYRVAGKGTSIVADMLQNKLIKSDPGGQHIVLGDIQTFATAASCGY
jgi:hypothetical protein